MNLNYEKIRAKVEHGGNHWTSYSDLFLVLSVVFLLLYVVANLRSGTDSIASAAAVKKIQEENEGLKKQIKVYSVLKDDYLKQGASNEEIEVYQELMGKLDLLETDAKHDRDDLYLKAQEAQDKEKQLNQYQAMVKNIIQANLVASAKLKKRDDVIDEKQIEISQSKKDVDELDHQVRDREAEIKQNTDKIGQIETALDKQIKEVQYAYRSKKNAKALAEAEIARLRATSEKQIAVLQNTNGQYVEQLQTAQTQIAEKNRESEKLLTQLNDKEAQYQATIGELGHAHQEALAREKRGYEEGMQQANMTADAKLAKERAYRDGVERQNALYNQKLQGLQGDLDNTRKNITDMQGRYQGSIAALQKANGALSQANGQLAQGLAGAQAKLNEQKELAASIERNFARAGIRANVDGKTGDVMISFPEDQYFDTGSANLKNGMRAIIEKAIPAYAKSLFTDPKIAKKISSIEIVGFASPTYKGKYIDPESINPNDRAAVNYNMDLSYQRAKSIFEYTFDTNKMTFDHQKDLLPLVKVSGRSYLATDKLVGRNTSSVNDEYCAKFDCKKTQKVIIKFNLRDE